MQIVSPLPRSEEKNLMGGSKIKYIFFGCPNFFFEGVPIVFVKQLNFFIFIVLRGFFENFEGGSNFFFTNIFFGRGPNNFFLVEV